MPFIFKIFSLLAVVQIGVAALGLISGINFLKLKAWSRSVLEGLTWLLLIFILGFMFFWVFNLVPMGSRNGQNCSGRQVSADQSQDPFVPNPSGQSAHQPVVVDSVEKPQETFWGGFSGFFADPDGYYWEVAWGPMFDFTENGDLKFKDD